MVGKRLLRCIATGTLMLALNCERLLAADTPGTTTQWIYPLIEGYGGVHPEATLPVRPDPGTDYKILADVIQANNDHAKVADSLDRLARVVNLMSYAGIPAEHVHIVAILDEADGLLALTNAAHHQRFKLDNPNLALLRKLKDHGVMLLVCSQAMAAHGLTAQDFSPDVTVTLSALTDLVVFGQRGYSYMQL